MPQNLETFRSFLMSQGLRITPQRRTILEAFEEAAGPVQCEELLQVAQKMEPELGLSTVYRTMKLLVQAGIAFGIHQGDGVFLHTPACTCGRNITMRCTRCGAIISACCPDVAHQLEQAFAWSGCTLTSQHHSLTGLCAQCRDGD